ncbi:MAG: DUF819 family protein [Cyclobacteriaceae bacterium]|nr:DUF819 family protein [Cyclobacteriaceae bacterium]
MRLRSVGGTGDAAIWRGMSTIAGSWIGGSANQAAMYEIFKPSGQLYAVMITIDVIVAEIWMAFILFGVDLVKIHRHVFGKRMIRLLSDSRLKCRNLAPEPCVSRRSLT